MDDELKRAVIPKLRAAGFKGSFPHFRRVAPSSIDLLTFQFDKYGGGFVVEIARCPSEGFTTSWGKYIPPNKVTAFDLYERKRIQATRGSGLDKWFRFDDGNYESAANQVIARLPEAEEYWKSRP